MIAQHTAIVKVFCKAMFDFDWEKKEIHITFQIKSLNTSNKIRLSIQRDKSLSLKRYKKAKETKLFHSLELTITSVSVKGRINQKC